MELRKRDGSPMDPGKEIVVDAGNLLISFTPGTSQTDNNGRVMLTLTRSLSAATAGFQKFPVTIGFGAMHKTLNVML